MPTYIAFLRGINVGKAKRVAMADLRALLEDLGHRDVSTLLMSGNAVFTSTKRDRLAMAKDIESAIVDRLGLELRAFVRTVADVRAAAEANPFVEEAAKEPSRLAIAFFDGTPDRTALREILESEWSPERFAVGKGVTYAWHPDGVAGSKLADALMKTKGLPVTTTRNLATVTKVLDRAESLS